MVNFKDADAVIAWFDGTDAIRFHTQYNDFGVWKRMPLIAAFHGSCLSPFIMVEFPTNVSDALLGTPGAATYTPLLETEISKQFVEAYKKKYPDDPPPDDTQSAPFMGYQIVYEALKATGGDTTPEKLREAILNTEVVGPEGPVRFDKEKRSAIKTVYIFEVEKRGLGFTWVPVHTYEDVPATGY
jgi:branched-chain amino acid transport system substrate-binding protein